MTLTQAVAGAAVPPRTGSDTGTTRPESGRVSALQLQLRLHAMLTRAIAAGDGTMEELFAPCVQALATGLGCISAGVWTLTADGAALSLCAATPDGGATQPLTDVRIGAVRADALAGPAAAAVVHDPRFEDPLFTPPLHGPEHHVAVAPLAVGGRLVGVLGVSRIAPLDRSGAEALSSVADLIALAIDRHRAADRLREREDSLGTLIGTAPDGIVVMDTHSRIIAANPSLEQIFGYEPGELVGEDVTVLMPERFRARHNTGIRRYRETGQKRISWHGIELVGLHKDGTEFPIEISFGEYAHNGDTVFTGFIRDITERKRSEAREQRRRRAIQTTALYVGSSLVTLQAADIIVPVLPLPGWTFRALVFLALCGLPLVVAVAWGWGSDVPTAATSRFVRVPALRVSLYLALVLLVVATALLLARPRAGGDGGATVIAILPFTQLDESPAARQYAGGITEDVMTAVAGLPDVRVVSRTSVVASAAGGRSLAQIGREVGARYVLEGSVRESGGRIRVSVRLALAGRDRHVWADTFDRQLDDAFSVQAGIAAEVADELRRLLMPQLVEPASNDSLLPP